MNELNQIKYKIGETYIKFDFEFTEKNKQLVKSAYLEYVQKTNYSLLINSDGIRISIEFDRGSLKTRITLWGTILYMGIANYGSFRAGLREIINDNKSLSEVIVAKLTEHAEINNDDVLRYERRQGIPGRLKDIYNNIDYLERNRDNYTPNEVSNILSGIKQNVADISTIIDEETKQQFMAELPIGVTHNLPAPSESGVNFLYQKYALKPEEDIEYFY